MCGIIYVLCGGGGALMVMANSSNEFFLPDFNHTSIHFFPLLY